MAAALRIVRVAVLGCLLAITLRDRAAAQTVWSGFGYSFAKANGADHMLPQNQDRLTPNVWLTRAEVAGLLNIAQESDWNSFSPADTQWATDLNNPGDMITATNWANLTFEPWIDAYGGAGGMSLPARLIGRDAVVHLIADDVYLDLRFTSWAAGMAGGAGGFSYLRSPSLVPEPSAIWLGGLAFCGLGLRRRSGNRGHR